MCFSSSLLLNIYNNLKRIVELICQYGLYRLNFNQEFMEGKPIIYLGIDPSMRYQPYVFVALDADLKIVAIGDGPLREVLSYAAGLASACVAINSPQFLNQGLVQADEEKQTLFPVTPSKRGDLRKIELTLIEEGIQMPRTAATEKDCPVWMRRGFKLYQRIAKLGYQLFDAEEEQERSFMEVQSEAVYSRLSGGAPMFDELALEGRLQRQLMMYEEDLPVTDAMKFFEEVTRFKLLKGILPTDDLYEAGELNAMAAAYTAWLIHHKGEQIEKVGDQREGQIYLPLLRDNVFRPKKESYVG